MDDPVPSVDFSPTGRGDLDSSYTLERSDIEGSYLTYKLADECLIGLSILGLLRVMNDLEQYALTLKGNEVALGNIRETRANLEKLISKMDSLESSFDRIAERSRMFTSCHLPWVRC